MTTTATFTIRAPHRLIDQIGVYAEQQRLALSAAAKALIVQALSDQTEAARLDALEFRLSARLARIEQHLSRLEVDQ